MPRHRSLRRCRLSLRRRSRSSLDRYRPTALLVPLVLPEDHRLIARKAILTSNLLLLSQSKLWHFHPPK